MKKLYFRNGFDMIKLLQQKTLVFCFIVLLFITHEAKGQYTQIPDPNFEQALINFGHDDILDGQVLTSTISTITSLSIFTSSITSIQGIEDFTNLTHLDVHNNFLTQIDVSSLSNLVYLDCSYNQFESINFSDLQHLAYINCSISGLTNLTLNNLPSLSELYCSNNQVTQLDVSGLINLIAIDCASNQLTSLNVNGLLNLVSLVCGVNNLPTLDISSLTSLYAISCGFNQLTTLDASDLPNLHHLFCHNNQLVNLDIRNSPSVNVIYSYANPDLTCILVDDVEIAVTTIGTVKDSFTQFSTNCTTELGPASVIPSQCGITLTKLNENIYANLIENAQAYRFKITDVANSTVQIIDRPLRVFQLTNTANYAYGKTYAIEVAPKINGVWLAYGIACEVTTPAITTQIQDTQCGSTFADLNSTLYANLVPYALGYRFRITLVTSGQVYTIDRPIRSLVLSSVPNIQYGHSFSVEVAVKNTNGVYMNFGPICQVYTGAMTKLQNEQKMDFKTIASPNPFDVTTQLYVTTSYDKTIELNIYDVLGRLVETKTIRNDNVNPIEIGSNYPSGVYMIVLSQNDELNTLRIIKR